MDEVIRFVCPTCGRKKKARAEDAGKAAQCSCGSVLVVPGSVAKFEVVEEDDEPKPKHFDWNEGIEPPGNEVGKAPEEVDRPEPREDEGKPELSDVRCFDCGSLIPEGEIVRITTHVGSTQGFKHYGRVSLCQRCYEDREREAERERREQAAVSRFFLKASLWALLYICVVSLLGLEGYIVGLGFIVAGAVIFIAVVYFVGRLFDSI